jgi:hypothetical protein
VDFLHSDSYIKAANPIDCPIRSISYIKCNQAESSSGSSTESKNTCTYHEYDDVLCLLAERSGKSKYGRIYNVVLKVNVSCADTLQQVTFSVTVPHDARGHYSKSCERGGKGYCRDQPAPPPPGHPVIMNTGRITTGEVSDIYEQKKDDIQSDTDNVLIVNNIMVGNNPVSVNSLGASIQTEKTFQYEIVLSESVDNSVLSLIRETQSQTFALPLSRFEISASPKRSVHTYIVTVTTDGGLSSAAIAGIVITCIIVVGIIVGLIFHFRTTTYAEIK